MTFDEVLALFPSARRSGDGWMAKCPAHEDGTPSLSINEGSVLVAVFHCHAGCTKEEVYAAAGLTKADLRRPKADAPKATRKPKLNVVAAYDYHDADGTVVYQSVRCEPNPVAEAGKEKKVFFQRRPDGSGGWLKNMTGVKLVPYRLPQLRDQQVVIVVEGEKDANRLAPLGYAVTTSIGGSGGRGEWKNSYAQTLLSCGAQIVGVIPDDDDPGRAYAEAVITACRNAGMLSTLIELPDATGNGYDVSDFLETHTAEDLAGVIQAAIATEQVFAARSVRALDTLLTDVETFVRRYVVVSDECATLLAPWIAHTHAINAFSYTPYLHVQSPTLSCGKTRLLETLEVLVPKPWRTARCSSAVLIRKTHAEHPVLLLDEVDAAFASGDEYSETMRGILNNGFQRPGHVSLCVGQGKEIAYQDFVTFCPKALAGLKSLPTTIESRAIPVVLKKRLKTEPVSKWRLRDVKPVADELRNRLAVVGAGATNTLKDARPALPEGLPDRVEDIVEPLLAIADLAGGDWPARTRAAVVSLMGESVRSAQESEQDLGLKLLADIRGIFGAKGELHTQDLLTALVALESQPWATLMKNEKPITHHKLASLLKQFKVFPAGDIRVGSVVLKGYRRAAFDDAFGRYLSDTDSEPLHGYEPNENGPKTAKTASLHASGCSDCENRDSTNVYGPRSDVAMQNPELGGDEVNHGSTDVLGQEQLWLADATDEPAPDDETAQAIARRERIGGLYRKPREPQPEKEATDGDGDQF